MRKVLLLVLMVFCFYPTIAKQYHYQYTDNCSKAYNHYLSLEPEQGRAMIRKELIADPYNLMATYISDYEDCLLLLFNGDKVDYEQLKGHLNDRLALMERGDENSPWHRLCKAGIYMHWAFVNIRFNENFKAAANFRKSYILLKENHRLFPSFEYNNIFLGIQEATIGALPDNYKWIVSFLGMRGNVQKGVGKVGAFLDNHRKSELFYKEAQVYYAYMNYYLLSDKRKAWDVVCAENFDTRDNLLNSFVKANLAVNYRKAADAIAILERVSHLEAYSRYPILEYEYGYALLHKQDEACATHFNNFLKNFKGGIFIKDCWQKLAYAYYLRGDFKTAVNCKNKILTEGSTMTDSDKQALRFAQQNNWPNKKLLKAQLLIDGGFYKEANALLSATNERDFEHEAEVLEYYFRQARLYDELGKTELARSYYQKAIDIGRYRQEQFAARAALQMGFLNEKLNNVQAAIKMYELALSMKNHDFKNSIDQQAKAGISRLSNKK